MPDLYHALLAHIQTKRATTGSVIALLKDQTAWSSRNEAGVIPWATFAKTVEAQLARLRLRGESAPSEIARKIPANFFGKKSASYIRDILQRQ